jgi:hypothetical protein
MFENEVAIGKSLEMLKKLVVEKIGGRKKLFF